MKRLNFVPAYSFFVVDIVVPAFSLNWSLFFLKYLSVWVIVMSYVGSAELSQGDEYTGWVTTAVPVVEVKLRIWNLTSICTSWHTYPL